MLVFNTNGDLKKSRKYDRLVNNRIFKTNYAETNDTLNAHEENAETDARNVNEKIRSYKALLIRSNS